GVNPVITNTGVLSFQGQTGSLSLIAGENISIDGLTISAEDDKGSDQSIFKNITVGATTIVADSNNDTISLIAGTGISLTPDSATDQITIAATSTNSLWTDA